MMILASNFLQTSKKKKYGDKLVLPNGEPTKIQGVSLGDKLDEKLLPSPGAVTD